MITELHTVALYVADQDRAKRFYVDTLGFDLGADQPGLGGIGRWIEVAPKGAQTDPDGHHLRVVDMHGRTVPE